MVEKSSTGWVGWIYFAAALLLVNGGMQIVAGLTGIFHGNFYATYNGTALFFNYGTWGWIHLLFGIAIVATGIGLITGKLWSQVAAIILVILAAISHMTFLSVYPWWSIILLIIDGLIIYALTMHGDEISIK